METEDITREEARTAFFESYEDMIRAEIMFGQLGSLADLGDEPMFNIIGADEEQRAEVNRGVDNAARRVVRETIADVYGYPDDRIEFGAGKKTPIEQGLLNEFGLLDILKTQM